MNPGREETFGLTVAEAMACGTYPIVYEGTACAEVVEQGIGRVTAGGVEQLAEAVRAYRANGHIKGIEKYAQGFSGERFGAEVLAAYGEEGL